MKRMNQITWQDNLKKKTITLMKKNKEFKSLRDKSKNKELVVVMHIQNLYLMPSIALTDLMSITIEMLKITF